MTRSPHQPSLFDEPWSDDLKTAIDELCDLLDHWQRLLSDDDWAVVVRTVSMFFRITTMEKPKKPKRKRGKR